MYSWIPALTTTSLLGVAIFLSKNWLLTRLKGSIAHEYNEQLENVKSELRKSEESYKSQLKKQEQRIEALQNGVLVQVTSRYATLYDRQLKAVELLWKSVVDLGGAKSAVSTMATVNYENAINATAQDNKARAFFDVMCQYDQDSIGAAMQEANRQRPFVSVVTWAYYAAYQSILSYSVLQVSLLKNGVGKDLTCSKNMLKLVTLALPHQAEYVENHGVAGCYFLLDELEQLLLSSFNSMLDGSEFDSKTLEKAAQITAQAESLFKESSKKLEA